MRKLSTVLALGLTLAVALAGCASAAGSGSTRSGTSTIITRDQLDQNASSTAYEIVQRLHPQWLIFRGETSLTNPGHSEVSVYLGSSRLGDASELRNFIGSQLESIRYLDARQATLRFGSGHVGGAIIMTQRQ